MRFPFFGRSQKPTSDLAPRKAPVLPARSLPRPRGKVIRRGFDAGAPSRFSGTLPTTRMTYNQAIKASLSVMRARSRDLAQNEPYAKHFLRMLKRNVIGSDGIRLESKAIRPDGKSDKDADRKIEEAFARWGKRGTCTADGELNWREVQQLFTEMTARDGEVLLRLVPNADNDFKFAIDLVSGQLIDERLENDLGNGIRIHMGVELDRFNRRRAVYIPDQTITENTIRVGGGRYRRIDTANARLCFLCEDTGQIRGVPFIYAGITRLEQMAGFEEAALVNARASASKLGFIEREYLDDGPADGGVDGDGAGGYDTDEEGNLVEDMEAGTLERLAPGERFSGFDPGFPNGETAPFIKAQLRGTGAALDVSYNSLGNDAEGVNYSSLRHFALEDRDAWKMWQSYVIDNLCDFVFPRFLQFAMLTGEVRLPFRDMDRFNRASWRPRRWAWIDPQKEQNANKQAIANGTKSRTQIAAEDGRDLADIYRELAEEQALAESYGLSIGAAPAAKEKGADDGNGED